MKKEEYIICHRCELNFILKKDQFCQICKAEMNGESSFDDLDLEVCPICKANFIRADEIMCTACGKEHMISNLNKKGDYSDEEWQAYLADDDKEDLIDEDEETGDMVNITELEDDDEDMDIDDEDIELDDYPEDIEEEEDVEESEEDEDFDDDEDLDFDDEDDED